jgi:hypothetical protein
VTRTQTCNGGNNGTSSITDKITWTKGVSSDLLYSGPNCTVAANYSNGTASWVAGATCTVVNAATGQTDVFNFSSYSWTLGASGTTATVAGMATVQVTAGGSAETCTITISGTYNKVGN